MTEREIQQLRRNLFRDMRKGQRVNRLDSDALKEVLREALSGDLTPRQLQCVELYYFDGRTQKEAGDVLGVNRATVSRHLKRARGRLFRALYYAGEGARLSSG